MLLPTEPWFSLCSASQTPPPWVLTRANRDGEVSTGSVHKMHVPVVPPSERKRLGIVLFDGFQLFDNTLLLFLRIVESL